MSVLVALWWGGRRVASHVLPVVAAVQQLGPLGPVLFILLYIPAVCAFVPASWLTVAGGAVFGLLPTVIYALVGTTLASTVAFLLGRYVARRLVARRLETTPWLTAIDRAVSEKGRRIVFLLRLSPVSPFNVLNYALGLTNLSARDFALASLIGMIPTTFMFAYAGALAGAALVAVEQAELPRGASYYAMLTAGLVATIVASTIVTRAARRALQDV